MIVSLLALVGALASGPAVKPVVEPFGLDQVKLTGGPWLHSFEKEEAYLLSRESERFLHNFRKNAGLAPKAAIYGGWENAGLAGHSMGHYLSACAQAYASTGDKRFKEKIDGIVLGLVECQAHRKDGMISAIPNGDKPWDEIRRGEIRSGGFDLNGMWSPWYTHHKVLVGLLDAYTLAGNRQALEVAKRFGDWMIDETKALTDDQWARMLRCEYGGINEGLAELYQLTGSKKYLDLAHKFYDHPVLDPIVAGQDRLGGLHSNTQIPKILGLARLSDSDGGGDYTKAVRFFWDTVVNHYTFAIGGNGDHESFTMPDKLDTELTTNTCETCCTYNMLKLTRDLFEWEPNAKYLDYYERAHLNDILPSQDPDSGMVTYFFPLLSGANRNYSDPDNDFSCCHGSGMENHTKHQDSVYFHAGNSTLYVAQFEPTELNWRATGIKLKQETDFPRSGKVKLTFLSGASHRVELKLRHPGWAGSFPVYLNGHLVLDLKVPDQFETLGRRWKKGDVLEFELPMALHTEPILGDANKVALFYGPMVLAADLGSADAPLGETPVLVPDGKAAADFVKQVGPEEFVIDGAARPSRLTLRPLYKIPHDRYAVYFDEFSEAHWAEVEAAYRAEEARIKDLESRTIDVMRVGEMQPERDHNLASEKCDVRDANGKGFRTPYVGGFFEFDLKVNPSGANSLVVTYWVNDRWKRGGSILVNGRQIAGLDAVNQLTSNTFQDLTYVIPEDLTKGQTKIRVRFEAGKTANAASVSQVRSIRPF